jgi:FkbM family methyltransferase
MEEMNVSLICACKNRYPALRVSLNSWLSFDQIKEIIIVDWSSDEPISHLTKLDPRIKVITVQNQKYFNQPQPLNLAASLATGDYILKCDTDYMINPYYNFFDKYKVTDKNFVSGHHNFDSPSYVDPETGYEMINKYTMTDDELLTYFNSYSPFFKYLTGLLLVKKDNFNAIGGYDETFYKYYAFEDDDICRRLCKYGLDQTKIDFDYYLIHLPHPDKKRIENFEGYDGSYEKKIIEQTDNEFDRWNNEYYTSQLHIKKNKELVVDEDNYLAKPQTKWNLIQVDDQNYFAEKIVNDKLKNFPRVYYLSLEESQDRRDNLVKQFENYGVTDLVPIISKRFAESNDVVTGKYLHQLNDGTTGCCVSHLKAIKHWYENTDDSYGFFCEDDISLEPVDYWNFTWEEFINKLPEDAECVQLLIIRNEFDTYDLRERYWDDWGATAYIITRDYAKKIIDNYIREDSYHLEIPNSEVMPLIENILFTNGKVYAMPLFVEDTNFGSTFSKKDDDDVNAGQKRDHFIASQNVINWWKTMNLSNLNLSDLQQLAQTLIQSAGEEKESTKTEIEQLLTEYSLDTENQVTNFNLGVWYWREGHTAPALSFFLRCAERAQDINLGYEALIWSSYCYDKQGTRDGSAKCLLQQAICLLPNRPEAYFILSRFHERREQWQDAYIISSQGLILSDFELEPLISNVDYPGKYGLLYEKAISSYWWGKTEESKNLLIEIIENYSDVRADYLKSIHDNLEKIGVSIPSVKKESIETNNSNLVLRKDFTFSDSFDWGELSYEDIITIDREIIHEQVYRFWRDVQENDVVVDVGASVGPFICSILENRPKKIYCVEPSKTLLKTLAKNCAEYLLDYAENPLVYVNRGIVDNLNDNINIFGDSREFTGTTFKQFIDSYSIDHINFLKIDCEGGEYSIFRDENMDFLLNKVEFIAMETHLNYKDCREKFKNFRNKYLTKFKDFKVMSCTRQNISWGNSIDIKEMIFDDNFIDNYTCEFMIYISNK